MIWQIQVLN